MKPLPILAVLPLLAGCAIIPDTPRVGTEAAAQGTAVGLGQPVWLGDTIVTPMRVTEDSRCPVDAECVWAGRLVVDTRISAAHWQQTTPLTLGQAHTVMNRTIALVSAAPEKRADRETDPRAYRFTFEGR